MLSTPPHNNKIGRKLSFNITPSSSHSHNKCSNCKRIISSNKRLLHMRFCKAHMTKCAICDELFPIDEINEHLDEHKTKRTATSSAKKPSTPVLMIPCVYCGLKLNKNEINDHEYICGARTQNCPMCGEFVTFKAFEKHLNELCKGFHNKRKQNQLTPISIKKTSTYKKKINNIKQRNAKKKEYSNIRKRMLFLDKEAFSFRSNTKRSSPLMRSPPEYGYCNNIRLTRSVTKNLFAFIENNASSNQQFLRHKRDVPSDNDYDDYDDDDYEDNDDK